MLRTEIGFISEINIDTVHNWLVFQVILGICLIRTVFLSFNLAFVQNLWVFLKNLQVFLNNLLVFLYNLWAL